MRTGKLLFAMILSLAFQGQAATLIDQNGWGRVEQLDVLGWEPVGIPDLKLLVDDDYAPVQALPFTVTWGGQSYDSFHMGSNGDVELLNAGDITASPGFGYLSELPSGRTFLLSAYDDLVGRITYEDKGDRVVFNYSVITYADDDYFSYSIDYLNTFQTVLHDDGTVEWNFLESNFYDYGYDLATGIQLAGQGSLLAVTDDIPAYQSFRFTPVPLPATLLMAAPLMLLLPGCRRRPTG